MASVAGLRVLRQIAESGSFTAAAARLGYTQSAVSRQAASLERSAGTALFERRSDGVRLTPAGLTVLRHARTILDSVAVAERELTGTVPRNELVRLGVFLSAGAVILPGALGRLAAADPLITVTTREGTTPALIRALRAGSIDLAVLTSRPPHRPSDGEVSAPARRDRRGHRTGRGGVLDRRVRPPHHGARRRAGRRPVDHHPVVEFRATARCPAWPARTAARPPQRARDWLTKLQLVAGGFGVTTVPSRLSRVLPPGVILLRVEGVPPEIRRILVARLPASPTRALAAVTRAVVSTA
ncbi:LysR family transcriptional regulator [Streptomyces sp. NPDC058290]|uniref:LysR family transcriptional regulator n=1 Tax=Streptomyces sp. NPDC058290 TaxID=3346426 RepID=UPI0036F0164B